MNLTSHGDLRGKGEQTYSNSIPSIAGVLPALRHIGIMPERKHVNLKLEMIGGASAGVVGTVIGYPLDLVKTRMQTSLISNQESFIRVGYRIARQEGITALYKGMIPPLISLSILNTGNFACYNYFRNFYHADRGWDVRNFAAGMSGAPLGSMVSTVENMIKTQMQLDNVSDKRFKGSWDCTKTLLQERGLKIIYLGYGINTVREAAFLGTYFYTYEGLRVFLDCMSNRQNYGDGNISTWTIPVAGGISGALSWFVTFPLDCVRAGVQGQRLSKIEPATNSWGKVICSKVPVKRISSIDVFKRIHKTKGFIGLYSGVTPTLARAFIVSASRFSAYELAVKIFGPDLKS